MTIFNIRKYTLCFSAW